MIAPKFASRVRTCWDCTPRPPATNGSPPSPAGNERLVALLGDSDATVRRGACESLVRARHPAPRERLFELMAEPNRFVAWAAGRALEQQPVDQWRDAALAAKNVRTFIQGAVALVTLGADRPTS